MWGGKEIYENGSLNKTMLCLLRAFNYRLGSARYWLAAGRERQTQREKDDYKERIFTHLAIKLLPEARGADTHTHTGRAERPTATAKTLRSLTFIRQV